MRVEAFEPDPALCQRLAFNLATNALAQVNLKPFALGSTEALVNGTGNSGDNRVEVSPAATSSAAGNLIVTTLAGFVSRKNITRIDELKNRRRRLRGRHSRSPFRQRATLGLAAPPDLQTYPRT